MNPKWIHPALVAVALMWGGVFIAVAKLLPSVDAFQMVTIRFTMISVAFVAIFAAVPELRPKLSRRELRLLVTAGALAVPGAQLPIVQGQRYLSPALVAVFVALSPAFAAVISAMFLKERFTARQLAGFVIAFGGSVVVILTGTGDGELTVDNPWGAALALLTPLCWASYTVMSKPLGARHAPLTAIGVAMIAGTILMAPLYPHAASALDDISLSGWGWFLYMTVCGTLLTYWIWYKSLETMPASKTSAYMYGVPFAALFWSWAVLDNVPSALSLLGGAVMIVGVFLTQWSGRPSAASLRVAAVGEP